jgi:hypothetical protein
VITPSFIKHEYDSGPLQSGGGGFKIQAYRQGVQEPTFKLISRRPVPKGQGFQPSGAAFDAMTMEEMKLLAKFIGEVLVASAWSGVDS